MNLFEKIAKENNSNLKYDAIDPTLTGVGAYSLGIGALGTYYFGSNALKQRKKVKLYRDGIENTRRKTSQLETEIDNLVKLKKDKNYIKNKALSQLKKHIEDYKKGMQEVISKNPELYKNIDHKSFIHQELSKTFGKNPLNEYYHKVVKDLDNEISDKLDKIHQHIFVEGDFHQNRLVNAERELQFYKNKLKLFSVPIGAGLSSLAYAKYRQNKKNKTV
jgi:hypothetical protein